MLLVTWEDDDIGVADEVEELGRIFREHLNYAVRLYRIPSENAQTQLQLYIARLINQCDEDNLTVTFYSRHGGPTQDRTSLECVWSA